MVIKYDSRAAYVVETARSKYVRRPDSRMIHVHPYCEPAEMIITTDFNAGRKERFKIPQW